jgi:cytochrome c556
MACHVSAQAADPKSATLYQVMKNVVAVQTQIVWDVGSKVLDDDGNSDASKLTPAQWQQLASAATMVSEAARTLAAASPVIVAAPGEKIDGEGTPGSWGAKEVQQAIDANPAAFRAFLGQLQGSMNEVIAATQTRNAQKLTDVSERLVHECEACHVQFWYPEQKKQ